MRLYLAGPMSGIEAFNIPAFDDAAAALRAQGHVVFSPAEIDGPVSREVLMRSATGDHADLPHDESWNYYLDRDIETLRTETLDAIVTLPGWERSPGANREVGFCLGRGIPVLSYEYDVLQMGSLEFDAEGTVMEHEHERQWDPFPDLNPPSKTVVSDGSNDPEFGHLVETDLDFSQRQRQPTGAAKDNRDKPPVDYLPSRPLLGAAEVMAFGARTYAPHNWRLGQSWSQTVGSILRHTLYFLDGEDTDPKSGLPHVDHLVCQALFLSEFFHTRTGTDDRWSSMTSEQREAAKA